MPNPDITTGSAAAAKRKKKLAAPSVVGRPAPHSPAKVTQPKFVVPKVLHPIDEVAIRRQRLLRTLGHPIVVDGKFGPRSQRAWQQVGLPADAYDRKLEIDRLAAGNAAILRGIGQQASTGLPFSEPSQNLRQIHELLKKRTPEALRQAQALATATGVTRPGRLTGRKGLRSAIEKQAWHSTQVANTRAVKARVDRALQGYFHPLDSLLLARIAARGVTAPGLGSLNGVDLGWLLVNDGVTIPAHFTTARPGQSGAARVPTQEFVRGLQAYVNRIGVTVAGKPLREDGQLDARTNDALLEAGRREQHTQEMEGFRELRSKLETSGAWRRARSQTGLRMHFDDAWRQARDGVAGWEATLLLSTAARIAVEDEPDRLYRQLQTDQLDAASFFAAAPGEQNVAHAGVSPWAGTPYAITAASSIVQQLVAQVPAAIAAGRDRHAFEVYGAVVRQLQAEAEFADDLVRGTIADDTVEYLTRRQVIPVLDSDGNPRFTYTRYGTRVPVTEIKTWTDYSSPHIVVHKTFFELVHEGDYGAALKAYPQELATETMTAPATPYILRGLHEAGRPAEWVTLQAVATAMQARDVFTMQAMADLRRSLASGRMAGTARDGADYDLAARAWFDEQGFWTQMALTTVFDPLNFVGKALKGAAILSRGLERYAFHRAYDLEDLARHVEGRVSIISEEALQRSNREIAASLEGPGAVSAFKQRRPLGMARTTSNQLRKLAAAVSYKGVRGVTPEALEEVRRSGQAYRQAILADPAQMHAVPLLERHGMSYYVDESMTQLSDVGERELGASFKAARPAMLAALRKARYSDHLVDRIDDYVFGMKAGSVPSEIATAISVIEREFGEVISDTMRAAEQILRERGGYQFTEDAGFHFANGDLQRTYRGLRLADAPEVKQYYEELGRNYRSGREAHTTIEVRNPGHGLPMRREQMEISVNREVARIVSDAMYGARQEYRRTGRMFDEDELLRRRQVLEHNIRGEVESHWIEGGGGSEREQAEALEEVERRHQAAYQIRQVAKASLDGSVAERGRKARQLNDMLDTEGLSGGLANALAQLGLKGRLKHAADLPRDSSLADRGLSADEALVLRARRKIEEQVGKFDPRLMVQEFDSEQMLDALEQASAKIMRELNGGEVPMSFDPEVWREPLLRYLDAEHPALQRKWYQFGPGKKGAPHAQVLRNSKRYGFRSQISTWEPTNAHHAAIMLHEIAHTMAWPVQGGRQVGDKLDDVALLRDELITSLVARQLRDEIFPDLDQESMALFDAALGNGFRSYYYSVAASQGEAMLYEASQGIAGFTATRCGRSWR
jgi:hypothetical protein